MGAICQLNQQQGQETDNFQETCNHMSTSREVKPKSTNTSIILDLRAKYLELDCNFCCKPQMKEMAVQTQVSFNNLNQQDTQKIKQLSQKKKKKRQINLKDKLQYSEEYRSSSASQSSQTQNQLSLFQVYNNQKKHKLQNFKPYMVLINSQQESMTYHSPQKQHN